MHKFTIRVEVRPPPPPMPKDGDPTSSDYTQAFRNYMEHMAKVKRIEFDTLCPNVTWAEDIAKGISDAYNHAPWVVEACDGMSHSQGPAPVLNICGADAAQNANI